MRNNNKDAEEGKYFEKELSTPERSYSPTTVEESESKTIDKKEKKEDVEMVDQEQPEAPIPEDETEEQRVERKKKEKKRKKKARKEKEAREKKIQQEKEEKELLKRMEEKFEIILLKPERRLYGLKLKNTLYFATLVELPCIIEAMKTLDYFNYFKS